MSSSTSDGRYPVIPPPPPVYLEERWFTFNQALVFSVVIAVPIVGITAGWVDSPIAVLSAFGGILVLLLAFSLSPLGVGFGHIRIGAEGLALWWGQQKKLPARELGSASVLEELEACAAARQGRYRGIKIPTGLCSYWMGGGDGPAVFVEQHRANGKTVGWLLATREPEAVIEALAEVRDAQGDG